MRRFDPDCEVWGEFNVSGREVEDDDASFYAVGSRTIGLTGTCEIVTSMMESVM
jgi:hypothetical protein